MLIFQNSLQIRYNQQKREFQPKARELEILPILSRQPYLRSNMIFLKCRKQLMSPFTTSSDKSPGVQGSGFETAGLIYSAQFT
jgi:hypothetical protein